MVKHGHCCKEFLGSLNDLLVVNGYQYCIPYPPNKPLSGGMVAIRFCPWCGKRLKLAEK